MNSPNVGFYWTNGSFTSINNNVGGQAKPFGVNNPGQIVGWYYPNPGAGGPSPGFLFDTSNGTVTQLTAPNALPDSNSATTNPYGINDASQVAGSWVDTSNNVHGFLYDNGAWTPLDHSGTKDTEIRGINGIGQVVGYYNGHGFVYSQADGWINFSCTGQSSTLLTGINNNGQVIGACGSTLFMYDLAHGTWCQVPGLPQLPPGGGVSDSNAVAGTCGGGCTSTVLSDGFYAYATPNP